MIIRELQRIIRERKETQLKEIYKLQDRVFGINKESPDRPCHRDK